MSGGHYNYLYYVIKETYNGELKDLELEEMMNDLCEVLKSLEWWMSGDTDEETYRKDVKSFKKKWFGKTQEDRLKTTISNATAKLIDSIRKTFGVEIGKSNEHLPENEFGISGEE